MTKGIKAKQIRTNSISRKVWDDQFLQILIDCRWNWNNRQIGYNEKIAYEKISCPLKNFIINELDYVFDFSIFSYILL
jgi:hypothetical protein